MAAVSAAASVAAVRVFVAIAASVAGGVALPAAFLLRRRSVSPVAGVPVPAAAGVSAAAAPA